MSGYMFRPPFRRNASFSQSIRLSVSVFVTECFSIMARQLSVRLSLCRAVNKMVWETKKTCINLLLWCLFVSGNRFDIFIGIRSSICIELKCGHRETIFPFRICQERLWAMLIGDWTFGGGAHWALITGSFLICSVTFHFYSYFRNKLYIFIFLICFVLFPSQFSSRWNISGRRPRSIAKWRCDRRTFVTWFKSSK